MSALILKLYHSKAIRYLFAAGIATVVDVTVYYSIFNYLLEKQNLQLTQSFIIGAPTVSLACSYSCGLVTNFLITKNFVFKESELRSRSQFIRFLIVAFVVLIANYYFMNFLIKSLDWYPTIARGFSAVSIGVFSFMSHKAFSFRIKS